MSGSGETEVADFKEILSAEFEGALPLLVGGHAVHIWASAFADRIGDELKKWMPLTSKDLDLFGTQEMLAALKCRFGGTYRLSGPRSPVVGQLTVNISGKDYKIDVLREVVGLHRNELNVDGLEHRFLIAGEWIEIRVVPLLKMLRAKITNLANLEQSNRNDFRHVQIMLLVAREHLAGLVEAVEAGHLESRAAIVALEETRKIILSREAVKCQKDHGISYAGIWPHELLARAQDQRLLNFARHRLP